jgi:hypothetical protein
MVNHVMKVIEDVWDIDWEPPLLFVRGATRVKSMMVRNVNQEPLTDLYSLVR